MAGPNCLFPGSLLGCRGYLALGLSLCRAAEVQKLVTCVLHPKTRGCLCL